MNNLKIRLNRETPEIDFQEFLHKEQDGIKNQLILAGAQGKDLPFSGQELCYETLWFRAWDFVRPTLKDYSGMTRAWYVDRFFEMVGFSYVLVRGERTVCYDGKPLA